MLSKIKYTEKEIDELVSSIVILVDSREKSNKHILDYFDKKKIKYKKQKLDYADYSFYVPANEKLNLPFDLYFDREIAIEKKNSLNELSQNFTKNRDRFKHELAMSPPHKLILIENNDFGDLAEGNYDTKYNRKSFIASIMSYWHRYNCPVFFIPNNKYTGVFIRFYFEYYLKEQLH